MSAAETQAQNDENPGRTIVVTGMPAGYSISVEGERVTVVRPDGGLSEWHSRPDTNGSGMYDLCLSLAALPSVTAGPSVPRLSEEGSVGEAFLALRALWDDEDQSPSWPAAEPLLESLAAALYARSGAGGLEVRTLDWRFRHEGAPRDNDFVADSPFGRYVIRPRNSAGPGFVALWVPAALPAEAVIFPDARLAKAAALRDLVGRVRSCFAPAVRPAAEEQGAVASRQRLSAERTIAHAAEEEEALRLDLADTRRKLERADGIVSLASALVSHGDAAGFDASVYEDCSPGFRGDFHALRRAVAEPGMTSVAASSASLERRVDAMGDYVSHHGDWRRACEIARDAAGPSGHDHDDRGYWQHQLDTLDRVEAALRHEGVSVVRHRSAAREPA